MDFQLDQKHEMARSLFREFAEKEVKPLAIETDETEVFPRETVTKMGKSGFLGIPVPKESGGQGCDPLTYVMCVEELAKVCGTTSVIVSAHTSLCVDPILTYGTEEQKKKYFLARGCSKVYLIHRRDELRAAKTLQNELLSLPNVEVVWDSVVKEIRGSSKVESVLVQNVKTKEENSLDTDACFVAVGITPETEKFRDLVECDEKGYIIAPETGATSHPGIYVAGDARKKRLRQIVTAVADGANAVTAIQDYLVGKS